MMLGFAFNSSLYKTGLYFITSIDVQLNFLKSLPIFPLDVWDLICPYRCELSEALNSDFSDPS